MIQSLFYKIWAEIYDNILIETKNICCDNEHLEILKDMLFYIQNNYSKKIKLSDIAKAGGVSKSSCTNIFKKYLNSTPVIYLINYRLKKSTDLLTNSNMTITEIAYEVGFSGTSYFTETFNKYLGCSPRKYRENK